jgi:membrane-associated phospholipid phosphatase
MKRAEPGHYSGVPVRRIALASAIFAALAGLAIATIDQPLARWLATREMWPRLWDGGIAALEYATGLEPWKWLGVAVLGAAAIGAAASRRWRPTARALAYIALVQVATRLIVGWIKVATGRLRPWEWLIKGGDTFFRDGIAFPSGHVAYFASLVLPIAVAWPRARWTAYAIVAYTSVARLAVGAHWVSDVFGGIAVAGAITWACSPALTWTPRASRR